MISADLRARIDAWIADDPDERDRDELRALLADDSAAAGAELADRFGGRLEFGTAGLRGAVAAGPNRMNRAVVRAATAALAGWLRARQPNPVDVALSGLGAAQSHIQRVPAGADTGPAGADTGPAGAAASAEAGASVVIGCDARHRSDEFADEAARVLAGAGLRVHMLPPRQPTPLLAFAVRHLSAAAGIMITASHNPPADNGYKVYLADGAQIVPPADAEIEAAIRALGPLAQVPVAVDGSPLIIRHGDEIADAYTSAVSAPFRAPTSATWLRFVYTPLHGVAAGLALRAFEQAGFPAPDVVAAQAAPDPDFPTVAFPNPEEPGALDLALAQARRSGADLVIANDPDGDRLAVAVPDPQAAGGWRTLTGDQLGALLGAYILERTSAGPAPEQRLVATTVVSGTMLSSIAAAAGAHYAETLTGFKWIVRAAGNERNLRFVFGYEEALGYSIGTVVRDKDGIGAALAALSLAARARSGGESLLDAYDALEVAHGVHLTGQLTLRTATPVEIMARLRAMPPGALGALEVMSVADLTGGTRELPSADVLTYRLAGGRVVIRPSGTEPKIKAYLEVVEPVSGGRLTEARRAAQARMGPLREAVQALLTS
ncbi:MAG TPA: phospho-sugar mutase [Streptosporangiaceae bacterium]|nr:phospho-sugar mutase [Streptosporangiaceae bacterium]